MKNLCITCAELRKIDKDGYITCSKFPKKKDAKQCGMTVFLHCYCSEHKSK